MWRLKDLKSLIWNDWIRKTHSAWRAHKQNKSSFAATTRSIRLWLLLSLTFVSTMEPLFILKLSRKYGSKISMWNYFIWLYFSRVHGTHRVLPPNIRSVIFLPASKYKQQYKHQNQELIGTLPWHGCWDSSEVHHRWAAILHVLHRRACLEFPAEKESRNTGKVVRTQVKETFSLLWQPAEVSKQRGAVQSKTNMAYSCLS